MTAKTRIVTITTTEGLAPFSDAALFRGFDLRLPAQQRADVHLVALAGEVPAARCSLWWGDPPPLPGERVGVVGHYAAAGDHDARLLLAAACSTLRERGRTLAVGPMDGSTWHRYRFVT
jgi:hypothetical protein